MTRPARRGIGCILVLHRVIPAEERSIFSQNRALEITPDDLRGILAWVRMRGMEPIALDQLPDRLSSPRGSKFVCFTLDDGCVDSLQHALPVFREFDVPFTVNVTNGFVSGTVSVWWYLLEQVLTHNWRLCFEWDGRKYEYLTDTSESRERAYDQLAELLRSLGTRREELVRRIAEAAEVDPLECTRRTSMTWDEVRQLAADPLACIGAHTGAHHSLNRLSEDEIRAEVLDAREELQEQIGRPVRHFAYPFGGRNAVNRREFELVRRFGFITMTTTRGANLYREHAQLMDRLPRLGVSGNYPGVDALQVVESGFSSALQWRLQRVIGE